MDARALKAYAGSAPITRASGRSMSVTHRHIKNNRLANVGWMWAFSAASNFQPARQHYRRGENTVTVTPPPTDICSTNSSDSSTTASNTDRPSTKRRHSRHRYATRPSAHFCPESRSLIGSPCETGNETPWAAETSSVGRPGRPVSFLYK